MSTPTTIMLSEHFSLAEAITSETAERHNIDNTPTPEVLNTMYKTAVKMEKVRNILGDIGIHINSWNRVPQVNALVGSFSNSQHIKGEAVDFICPRFGTPLDICKKIIENKSLIQYDKLILEHTWIHISFAILSGVPRDQVLSLLSNGHYAAGLTDRDGVKYE